MALSDSLFDVHQHLQEEYDRYCADGWYTSEVKREVKDILKRLDKLRGKIDTPYYDGSMRFDDNGAWVKYLLRVRAYRHEVFELAGDISNELYEGSKVIFSDEQMDWHLAVQKINKSGRINEYYAIRKKYGFY